MAFVTVSPCHAQASCQIRVNRQESTMASRVLITGATGFLGGHLAEAFRERGWPVSTIARPGSDTKLLEQWGVTIHRGDLTDPQLVAQALTDVEAVVHCAAKVGDW